MAYTFWGDESVNRESGVQRHPAMQTIQVIKNIDTLQLLLLPLLISFCGAAPLRFTITTYFFGGREVGINAKLASII